MDSNNKDDPFLEFLKNPCERTNVEFKSPAEKEALLGQIAKAVVGFANYRDGGFIIVGGAQKDGQVELIGLTEEEIRSYDVHNFDKELSKYGDPRIGITDCRVVELDDKKYICVRVRPFSGKITVCKKFSGVGRLKDGTVYVRSNDAIESRPANASEMKELVESAVELSLKSEIERLIRIGILRSELPCSDSSHPAALYEKEREGF